MIELNDSVTALKGVGPKILTVLRSHGVNTVEDLFYFFPRAWMDASRVTPVEELRFAHNSLVQVTIVSIREGRSLRTKLPYLRALATDKTGSIEVLWFHPRFIRQRVRPNITLLLYGKLQSWPGGSPTMISPKILRQPEIVPVYPEITGLPSFRTRALIAQIKPTIDRLNDYLPTKKLVELDLISSPQALREMHFPSSVDKIELAQKRLGFDEMIMFIAPALRLAQERDRENIVPIASSKIVSEWIKTLPFTLTDDQQRLINEILRDLRQTRPMNRLLQGDVGSGKTVVGLAGVIIVGSVGRQTAWLAPTEILARQHYETTKKLLAKQKIKVALWTHSQHLIASDANDIKATSGDLPEAQLIIGTHALLQEKLSWPRLSFLIIDEQHRFGVEQRAKLRNINGTPIHLLSMTATPIPRTMALVFYSDLAISTIRQKPLGRQKVITRIVGEPNRPKAYEFIDNHISRGEQAFVVCPLIEPSNDSEANLFVELFGRVDERKAVTKVYDDLKKIFPNRRLGLLHGRLTSKEKEATMNDFRSGKIDLLVTTTVIEVGVDIPNATIMLVESAELFGLAQLHQLRGRVGRSDKQSYCLLFPSKSDSLNNQRLKALEKIDDGFALAQKDLELRGPGQLTGLEQSGALTFKFASLADSKMVEAAQKTAKELLSQPDFVAAVDRFKRLYHPE